MMFVSIGIISYIRFRLGYFDEEEYKHAEWNRWYDEQRQQMNEERWWYYGRIDYDENGQSSEERYEFFLAKSCERCTDVKDTHVYLIYLPFIKP